jgi:hypothetical protein
MEFATAQGCRRRAGACPRRPAVSCAGVNQLPDPIQASSDTIIHPDVVTVGDKRQYEVSHEFHFRVWLRVRFLGHANSPLSSRPRVSPCAPVP